MEKGEVILKHKRRKTNVTYSDGVLTNRYKNEYQKLVRNTNAKRNRMIDKYYNEIKNTPNMTGISKEAFAKQLEDKGFISKKGTPFDAVLKLADGKAVFDFNNGTPMQTEQRS